MYYVDKEKRIDKLLPTTNQCALELCVNITVTSLLYHGSIFFVKYQNKVISILTLIDEKKGEF